MRTYLILFLFTGLIPVYRNPLLGTLSNREDPDEMPHDVSFHPGLHCLLRQNPYSEKEKKIFRTNYNIHCRN